MERRTQADVRKENFNREAKIAKELAELALQDVDDALAERQDMFDRWIATGSSAVEEEVTIDFQD